MAQIKGAEVILNWQAGDTRTVAYNIYKTVKKNFLTRKTKNMLNIKSKRFEDKDIVRGITYEYRIEAIDKYGLVSKKTPAATLTIPRLEKIEDATSVDK